MTENYTKYKRLMMTYMSITNLHNAVALLRTLDEDAALMYDRDTAESINCVKEDFEDVLEHFRVGVRCPRCNSELYLSDLPQYDYVCVECDENFYAEECE